VQQSNDWITELHNHGIRIVQSSGSPQLLMVRTLPPPITCMTSPPQQPW